MNNSPCIFCNIAQGKIPCRLVWADDRYMAFYDIHPKAPVHFLVIPKHHISQFSSIDELDRSWLADFMLAIKVAAESLKLTHYKVGFNNGAESGQEIFHLHAHVMQS